MPVDQALGVISCSAKGEPAWPPLALFKAMLLSIWYDLFRGFCGSRLQSRHLSERLSCAFEKPFVVHGLDKTLFNEITRQNSFRIRDFTSRSDDAQSSRSSRLMHLPSMTSESWRPIDSDYK